MDYELKLKCSLKSHVAPGGAGGVAGAVDAAKMKEMEQAVNATLSRLDLSAFDDALDTKKDPLGPRTSGRSGR